MEGPDEVSAPAVCDFERLEENRELRYINPMEDWDGYDEP